jgi:hypothetical protein
MRVGLSYKFWPAIQSRPENHGRPTIGGFVPICLEDLSNGPKRPRLPAIAGAIDRSSPRTFCQVLAETRLLERGRSCSNARSPLSCLSISSIVYWVGSMTQPNITLRVVRSPSSFKSFLVEMGSVLVVGSFWSIGRKTRSMLWNLCRVNCLTGIESVGINRDIINVDIGVCNGGIIALLAPVVGDSQCWDCWCDVFVQVDVAFETVWWVFWCDDE